MKILIISVRSIICMVALLGLVGCGSWATRVGESLNQTINSQDKVVDRSTKKCEFQSSNTECLVKNDNNTASPEVEDTDGTKQ